MLVQSPKYDYHGKKVRLRAVARAELADEGFAFLRMRTLPPGTADPHEDSAPIFDNLDKYRMTSPQWRIYEIIAEVPEDAAVISYGLFLAGNGTAWLDEISVEVID